LAGLVHGFESGKWPDVQTGCRKEPFVELGDRTRSLPQYGPCARREQVFVIATFVHNTTPFGGPLWVGFNIRVGFPVCASGEIWRYSWKSKQQGVGIYCETGAGNAEVTVRSDSFFFNWPH